MGGVLILLAITVSCLLWGDLQQTGLWLVSIGYFRKWFGGLGG